MARSKKERDYIDEDIDDKNIENLIEKINNIKKNDYESLFVVLAEAQGYNLPDEVKDYVKQFFKPILLKIKNKTLSAAEIDTILYLLKKEFNL